MSTTHNTTNDKVQTLDNAFRCFRTRIKALRKQRQWKQHELAEKINISTQCISHFESGSHKPSFDSLLRLTEVFNVSADYLLGRSESPERITPHQSMAATHHALIQRLSADIIETA